VAGNGSLNDGPEAISAQDRIVSDYAMPMPASTSNERKGKRRPSGPSQQTNENTSEEREAPAEIAQHSARTRSKRSRSRTSNTTLKQAHTDTAAGDTAGSTATTQEIAGGRSRHNKRTKTKAMSKSF
jgi:hypothetical protein